MKWRIGLERDGTKQTTETDASQGLEKRNEEALLMQREGIWDESKGNQR